MAERTCTHEGCDRRHQARGLCAPHYKVWQVRQPTYLRTQYPCACTVCGKAFTSTKPESMYCTTGAGSCEASAKAGTAIGTTAPAAYIDAVLDRVTSPATRIDIGRYNRALRRDPCAYCGDPSQARDHIVPKSHAGTDDWPNRIGACHRCNGTKMQTPLLIFLAWKRARDEFEPWRQIVAAIHTRAA